jgi:hypothetical protein
MNDKQQRAFADGEKQAYISILRECLRNLGINDLEEIQQLELFVERQNAITALREVCKDFGDNDWSDNLHLADVIRKHLARPLHNSG